MDDPPFLTVGTEVSAKFKGAFCEAKIKKISKSIKCKVQYSNGISTFVTDDAVKGQLKVGATVDIKISDKKELVRATIQKIQDCSQYTVVFGDGDIACLKRTSLCLNSGRHFANSATLDQLPLTHPEHIGVTPVRTTIFQSRISRAHKKRIRESRGEKTSAMEENDIGKVACVEANDKKKVKDNWFPGLIVAPTSQTSVRINIAENYLVRSFKDGKYYTVLKRDFHEFTKEIGSKVENPTLKTAVEKALFYLEKDELPPHWNRDLLFGVDKMYIATDCAPIDSDNSDKESIEEKDQFVALLYKFMDDRGTPLNQAPVINDKDVDLYRLFKVVNDCGGYNKVNKNELWKFIAFKAGHEKKSYFSVKVCYQQYLHSFEDFYRKLGCTMLNHSRGKRSHSRFSRKMIRGVDMALPSISSATDKTKFAKNKLKDKKNDSAVIEKTAKAIKAEKKLVKNKEETPKKDDKKKENIVNSTSCNKLSVKCDPKITESKDPVRNSKTKNEMKEILKKEIKKEIDSDAEDDDQIIEEKNLEKKILAQTITKKEKVVKGKSANTGLPGMRKMRAVKEQIKTFVKEIIPFKKSRRIVSNTQQGASNNGKLDEELSEHTLSKTKEKLSSKSRRLSLLSNFGNSVSVVQLTQPGNFAENLVKTTKENGYEKKKTGRNKKYDKDEKTFSNDKILTHVNIENVPFDKDSPVVVGDNLGVYYGNEQVKTYNAIVLSMRKNEVGKYFVHYKGWNSRYDEWIDRMRIAYITKNPKPGREIDNANSSKSSPLKQKNVDLKKGLPTISRTKSSVTPLTQNSNVKKSPFSSARPTRTCTLSNRPLYNIDNIDSEGEYTVNVGSSKQYSKKKVLKSEPDVIIKSEPLDIDDQEMTLYPKTYPSKKVLMQRSGFLKPKSSVFKVQNNKSKEVDVGKQVPLNPPFDFTFSIPTPSYSIKPNADNENVEAQNKNKLDDGIELKIAPNDCLSPKVKSERNDQEHFSESSICENESFILDQQIEIETPKINEPITGNVYEFKESELCNFGTISSETEEKLSRSIQHDSEHLYNSKKLNALQRFIDFPAQEEEVDQNRSMIPFVTNTNMIYSFDNNIEIKVNDNLNIMNETKNPIMINQSESNEFQNLMIREDMVHTPNIKEVEQHFQGEVNVSDLQYEVLDLCMKPPESPPANVFSIPKYYELNDMIVEEEDDDEDYDESKLVIVENDEIETDYQKDSDLVISEEHNSSSVPMKHVCSCNIEAQSLSPLRPSVYSNIELEYKSSSQVKRDLCIPRYTDDKSTTFCNESIHNNFMQRNHLSQNRLYMDDNDRNTKFEFDFYSNSKLPSIEVKEIVAKHSINDMKCDFEVENIINKYEKEKTIVLPASRYREEIKDKNTLNNVLVIEYNCRSAEYDIHKPGTSKSFYNSIHQPGINKDSFYETGISSDAKNSFFEDSQAVNNVIFNGKSSLFDPNIPSCSTKEVYDYNIPSTSKSNFYENSLPSTSKGFYNSGYDVNNALIYEETISGGPTDMSEEQLYDQEERKRSLQTLYKEREAVYAMYAMKHSLCIPRITSMGATEEEMKEYTNIHQKDGAILDQQNLMFLAEISSKHHSIITNESSVPKPLERGPATVVEEIGNPPKNLQLKRKISSHEPTPKRSLLSTSPVTTAPEMKSSLRQADLLARMNVLREIYSKTKHNLAKIEKKRKKIEKRKKKQAKSAKSSQEQLDDSTSQ